MQVPSGDLIDVPATFPRVLGHPVIRLTEQQVPAGPVAPTSRDRDLLLVVAQRKPGLLGRDGGSSTAVTSTSDGTTVATSEAASSAATGAQVSGPSNKLCTSTKAASTRPPSTRSTVRRCPSPMPANNVARERSRAVSAHRLLI